MRLFSCVKIRLGCRDDGLCRGRGSVSRQRQTGALQDGQVRSLLLEGLVILIDEERSVGTGCGKGVRCCMFASASSVKKPTDACVRNVVAPEDEHERPHES